MRGQSALYNQAAAPLWLTYLGLGLPQWANVLTIAAASGLAVALVLFGNRPVLGGSPGANLGELGPYVSNT